MRNEIKYPVYSIENLTKYSRMYGEVVRQTEVDDHLVRVLFENHLKMDFALPAHQKIYRNPNAEIFDEIMRDNERN